MYWKRTAWAAKADVKNGKRPTILPYYLIQSFSLFFIFTMFKSFQFPNPPICSYRVSLTSVLRCYTSIFDGLVEIKIKSKQVKYRWHIGLILIQINAISIKFKFKFYLMDHDDENCIETGQEQLADEEI